MLRRLLTTLLGAVAVALLVVTPAQGAAKPPRVPVCPPVTVEESAKAATAIFSGTVSDVTKQPRTDGVPGAIYLQTVTVDLVYRGEITTETVQVQTDRNRADCSLGALQVDREYMFFVSGNGQPWIASGTSGTRIQNDKVLNEITELLGEGESPIDPTPETATFTPVDTSEPQSLSRAAAPGAALVLIGLLGLVVVRGVSRRSR